MSPTQEGYPCSPQQKRLWRLQRETGPLRIVAVLSCNHRIDPVRLRWALLSVLTRHDGPRTRLLVPMHRTTPMQVIDEEARLSWRELPPHPDGPKQVRELLRQGLTADAEREETLGPRAVLLHGGKAVLVLSMPAHGCDRVGMNLLREEFDRVYRSEDEAGQWEDPIQYPQYSEWLDELEAEEGGAKAFWAAREGETRPLVLPREKPARSSFQPVYPPLELPWQPASIFQHRYGSDPEAARAFFLTCWFLLLARYSGEERLTVATDFHGRTFEGLKTCLGLFERALPLTRTLALQTPFHKAVRQTLEELEIAGERQEFFGFGQPSAPVRQGFAHEVVADKDPEDFVFREWACYGWLEPQSLKLHVMQGDGEATLLFYHDGSCWEPTAVSSLARGYRALLDAALDQPARPISTLPVMDEAERHLLLHQWNPPVEPPPPHTISFFFEALAAREPQRIALVFEERHMGLGELDRRSQRLARHLRGYGFRPGDLAGLFLDRSPELVIAILAVLKAGGAFVPLDVALPHARLSALLAGGPRWMLACGHVRPPRIDQITLLELDEIGAEGLGIKNPCPPIVEPSDPAYMIFTSGSSGKPKGVLVSHGNLAAYVHAARDRLEMSPQWSCALVTTPSADLGYTLLFPSLFFGGTIHLLSRDRIGDALAFGRYMRQRAVDTLKITPSHLEALMHQTHAARVLPRKTLILGGEAFPPKLPRQITVLHPSLRIFNHYGPTETTVGATACLLLPHPSPAPIGKPMRHARAYLLDGLGLPVPLGTPAVLYLGGACVSLGYLNRPDLTAAAYSPDPFSDACGSRLYRTGDRCRYQDDGKLVFLGRMDRQVKIHGYRLELAEIEGALGRHPQIRAAAVVPRTGEVGGPMLTAYLVADKELAHRPEPGRAIRQFLAEYLPAYMLPVHWLFLDALPCLAGGKLDIRSLPVPAPRDGERSYTAPRDALERTLAGIWSEYLASARPIGVYDDFFSLGGHSLNGTMIMARVNETFSTNLVLASIFEEPTLSALAALVRQRQGGAAKVRPIPRQSRAGDERNSPLSFAQERLWFLERLEGTGTLYSIPATFRLDGRLSPLTLERALSEIIRRHEILRTTFHGEEVEPHQRVHVHQPLLLVLADLAGLEPSSRAKQSRRLAARDAGRAFDLERGPLIRLLLVRTGAWRHRLLVNKHHLISDAWSNDVLVRELVALYRGFLEGSTEPLAELPIQYGDYAAWQRDPARAESQRAQLAFWQRQLEGIPGLHHWPTDRPRPPLQDFRGAVEAVPLEPALCRRVRECGNQWGITRFMLLEGAFAILVSRYSQQTDVVIGTPVANRGRPETEPLIGCFVNTLVLRNDLRGNPSFAELTSRTRTMVLAALAHQDAPFERVVENLQPERDLSHAPLFQILFNLRQAPLDGPALAGVAVTPLEEAHTSAKFDLTLTVTEYGDAMAATLQYSTALFEAATIARVAGQLCNLLQAITTDPHRAIEDLPLMGKAERRRLLRDWNDTRRGFPRRRGLHQWVTAQGQGKPDQIALVWRGRHISRDLLETLSHALAGRLRGLGVGNPARQTLVGVLLRREPSMIAALLGILKAGAAYVPLELDYPTERIAQIASDAGIEVLLTRADLLEHMPSQMRRIIVVDGPDTVGAHREAPAAFGGVSLDTRALAYVLYTSGSTGKPKGVAISHRNVSAFLAGSRKLIQPAESAGILFSTSLCFDLSVFEIFTALSGEGALVLAENALELTILPERHRLTLINTVPSSLEGLLRLGGLPASLTTICLGGDRLPGSLVGKLFEDFPGIRLLNLYGPTEATVYATYAFPEPDPWDDPAIGRPLENYRAHVLDARLNPHPTGVVGVLYLAGEGLARGYFAAPDLTAIHFLPDPFADEPGARIYHTGDLARYRNDGRLLFLGRRDQQVKLRGFRIELGEIETALGRHPRVHEAVVGLFEPETRAGADQRRLVAWLVSAPAPNGLPNPGATLRDVDAADIRNSLERTLPPYMIPSIFIALEALPLTANGKLDRPALPRPDRALSSKAAVTPRTPVEEALVDLWSQVLKIPVRSIEDNFFELGGHSLLATQLMFRIRQTLAVDLGLRGLFEAPTIAALATRIESSRRGNTTADGPVEVRAFPEDRFRPFPLTDIQQAYWVGRGDAFELGNVATHTYREIYPPSLDLARFEAALGRLIQRHEMLRAVVLDTGEQAILAGVPDYRITLLDPRWLDVAGAERVQAQWRERLSRGVMPAGRWPLFDIHATALPTGIRLHIRIDALIADGWSTRLLARELLQLYQNPEYPLPSLNLSFRDYVLACRAMETGNWAERCRTYWFQRLDDFPRAPELPLACDPAGLKRPRFGRRRASLERPTWDAVKRHAAKAGLTPAAVLLAAYAEVLQRWSQGSRFIINLTLFNRLPLHPQINEIVGDFTSATLLEVDHRVSASFTERARRLQRRLWLDLDHRLVSAVQILRELGARHGGRRIIMPVVCTIVLGGAHGARQDAAAPEPARAEPREADERDSAETYYGISQTSQVRLDNQASEVNGRLSLSWDAVEDLYPEGMLDAMFAAYCRLLRSLAEDETTWRDALPELVPAQQLAQRAAVNDTHGPLPDGLLFDALLARAASQPQAPAIITPTASLSYGELCRKARGLAYRLREWGVRPGELVAVVMEKGWQQVVAALGAQLADAAYLPIDAGLPRDRRFLLLQEGLVRVALTQSRFHNVLEWPEDIRSISVDGEKWEQTVEALPLPRQKPDDPAYVMFTSGSTGKPKGVVISHRAALNTIEDINRRFGVGSRDRVLALSAFQFDLSVYDLFGLLSRGGALVLPEPEGLKDPAHWLELIQGYRVSLWNTVPTLLQMLVDYLETRPGLSLPSLSLVLLSGDWIPLGLPDRIKKLGLNMRVIGLGGATEAAIWSNYFPIEVIDPAWRSIPYGKPLTNQSFAVLDDRSRPCPVWVPGRLYIGGAGLAMGYWHDQAKTNAAFIEHPVTGERLYHTGDMGRYLPDGNLEFLGRRDFQVKIQGHRVELGEIEAVLGSHSMVRHAVVLALGKERGRKFLAAYVQPVEDAGPTTDLQQRLTAFLGRQLPEYMVPGVFSFLDSIPLTATGKIDRQALPQPMAPIQEKAESRPLTPGEELIAGVWAEVLGLPEVGVQENFFELGGHSLLAIQMAARLQDLFGVELSLRNLFIAPTVVDLAEAIETQRMESEGEGPPPIRTLPRDRPLPLSFAQQRLWFLHRVEGAGGAYHMPFALRLEGDLHVRALVHGIESITRRHESLRITLGEHEGEPLLLFPPVMTSSPALPDLAGLSAPKREWALRDLITREEARPFNLAEGPLSRVILVRLNRTDHVLLVTMHHLISDGWSIGLFIRELAVFYGAFVRGVSAQLPDLPFQYADFASWQRSWLCGERLERQLRFWRDRLEGAPDLLSLPLDLPRPSVQSFQGKTHRFRIGQALTMRLKSWSRSRRVTLFMCLQAAFGALLARYSGQDDIVVGTPINNRNFKGLEKLIGFFVNTLAPRYNLAGDPTFQDFADRVRNTLLDAYAHQDIPFEKVVDALKPKRHTGRGPLFQVMFTFQENPMGLRELHGLKLTGLQRESTTSKFDLTLGFSEVEGVLQGVLEYSTDLFFDSTIRRVAGQVEVLLTGIADRPTARISELPLLTAEERHSLVVDWNRTEREPKLADLPIQRLFKAQARRTADAIALSLGERRLSYRACAQAVASLASVLRALGIGAEVATGVAMDRTPGMVIAMLAVFEAGGVYVPLDPGYPTGRLGLIAEDARLRVVITRESFAASFANPGRQTICLDRQDRPADYQVPNARGTIEPGAARAWNDSTGHQLAYMIFTSGSSGRPKGVAVSHRALSRHCQRVRRYYAIESEDVVLHYSSIHFDVSLEAVLPPLMVGASVVLRGDELWTTETLARVFPQTRIAIADLPPFVLLQLLEHWLAAGVDPSRQTAIKLIITGGEAVPAAILERWRELGLSRTRLVNAYGPTEATVAATVQEARRLSRLGSIPIGRGYPGRAVFIVDRHLNPVSAGVAGELLIGGECLARGYTHRPESTAVAFIPEPFARERGAAPGGRLYKTGDLARFLGQAGGSAGPVEFLARLDTQVKLRGFRVELGEIETVLARHPAVREAVVIAAGGTSDRKRLTAHVVPRRRHGALAEARVEFFPSVGEYPIYDEYLYYSMTHDRPRTGSYERAIKRAAKDRVVLDIGTGRYALLSRLAVAAGAKKVYAIEVLDHTYKQAKTCIERHGLSHKITLIHGSSTQVKLPERVDLCLSEVIGTIGGSEGATATLNDARRRFLKDDGLMIPWRCITWVAALQLPDMLLQGPRFSEVPGFYVKRLFRLRGRPFDPRLCLKNLDPACLISDSGIFEDLDFSDLNPAVYERELVLHMEREARFDGFLLWIHLYTDEHELVDTLIHQGSWLPVYFPAFHPGIRVHKGDRIELTCRGAICANGINQDYGLEGRLIKAGGEVLPFAFDSPHEATAFQATPFYRAIFPRERPLIAKEKRTETLADELKAYLRDQFPDYMLPSRLVFTDALPLNPNGKVDRAALARRTEADAGVGSARAETGHGDDPVEETLRQIWAEVLGLERIGRKDNFFDLGGHSLMATRVASRIRKAFQVELDVRALFEHARLMDLATHVTKVARHERGMSLPRLEPRTRPAQPPLSHAQRRLWLACGNTADTRAYHVPFALEISGALDIAALEHAFAAIIRRHEVLRTTIAVSEEQPYQKIQPFSGWRMPVVDLRGLPQEQVRDLGAARAQANADLAFDLGKGPLIRVALVTASAGEALLLCSMHHIVADGWSVAVAMGELRAFYESRVLQNDREPPLPAIQYADYAIWQNDWSGGSYLEKALAFWRERLRDLPAIPSRLYDHPHSERVTGAGGRFHFALDEPLTAALRALCRREGATLFMVLLAGLEVVLHYRSGGRHLAVGTDVANRGQEELEPLIGFFINQLVLPVKFDGNPSFSETLRLVREATLSAYAYQDLPFDLLVEALNPARGRHITPFFQVKLVLQNAPAAELSLPAIEMRSKPLHREAAKLDLQLNMTEIEEGLRGEWVYRSDVFESGTIERIAAFLEMVLGRVGEDSSITLDHLRSLLEQSEREIIQRAIEADKKDRRRAFQNILGKTH